jgi:centromeric protein E
LRCSYLEIYNEVITDLLVPENTNLPIHEHHEKGVFVGRLKEEIVTSPEQVLQIMAAGEVHRHVGSTNMNEHSSRSHTIFRMVVESREKDFGSEKENNSSGASGNNKGRGSLTGGAVKVSLLVRHSQFAYHPF